MSNDDRKTGGRRAPFLRGTPVGRDHDREPDVSRVIALIDMNAFFAQVEQICNPSLRGKPLLVGGDPKKRSIVAAASYEAKACGVRSGMSYYEAKKLCPDAIAIEGDSRKYLDYCYRIVDIFREFTDVVEAFSIDEAFLDLTNVQRLFGTPERICGCIKERLVEDLGLTCSVGIGPNKLVAKMASNMQKPDGLTRIWPEELPHILWPFPVEELTGVGRRMKRRLARMGISTIGDLGRFDPAVLRGQFGVYGELLHQWANGIDESPVDPTCFQTVKSVGHSYTLPRDIDDTETARWFIFWLSDRVCRRMRRDNYVGRTITLTVRNSDFLSFTRSLTLPEHTSSVHTLRDRAMLLYRRNVPPGMKVRLLGVSFSHLKKETPEQMELFSNERQRRAVDAAVDAVKDKYGDSAITFATLIGRPRGMIRRKIGCFLTSSEKGKSDSPLARPPL